MEKCHFPMNQSMLQCCCCFCWIHSVVQGSLVGADPPRGKSSARQNSPICNPSLYFADTFDQSYNFLVRTGKILYKFVLRSYHIGVLAIPKRKEDNPQEDNTVLIDRVC